MSNAPHLNASSSSALGQSTASLPISPSDSPLTPAAPSGSSNPPYHSVMASKNGKDKDTSAAAAADKYTRLAHAKAKRPLSPRMNREIFHPNFYRFSAAPSVHPSLTLPLPSATQKFSEADFQDFKADVAALMVAVSLPSITFDPQAIDTLNAYVLQFLKDLIAKSNSIKNSLDARRLSADHIIMALRGDARKHQRCAKALESYRTISWMLKAYEDRHYSLLPSSRSSLK